MRNFAILAAFFGAVLAQTPDIPFTDPVDTSTISPDTPITSTASETDPFSSTTDFPTSESSVTDTSSRSTTEIITSKTTTSPISTTTVSNSTITSIRPPPLTTSLPFSNSTTTAPPFTNSTATRTRHTITTCPPNLTCTGQTTISGSSTIILPGGPTTITVCPGGRCQPTITIATVSAQGTGFIQANGAERQMEGMGGMLMWISFAVLGLL